MDASRFSEVTRCLAAADAAACRDGLEAAASATAPGVAALADCVLGIGAREDGVWFADLLATTAARADLLIAAANAAGRDFDPGLHGVAFASALDPTTQRSLGESLASLELGARERIVSLALAYDVAPLVEYCGPYVAALSPDDPAVGVFARHVADDGGPSDAGEAWALVASRTWTVADALECDGSSGCSAAGGELALAALFDLDALGELGAASTPNLAVRRIRSGELSPAAVRGLVYAITSLEYDQRATIVSGLLSELTSSSTPVATRRAIAEAGTPALCASAGVIESILRVPTSDPDRFTDPSSPWPTYIRSCAPVWDTADLITVLSAGSWLGVPAADYDALLARLADQSASVSCEALSGAASAAYGLVPWLQTRDLAWPLAALARPGECGAELDAQVDAVAARGEAHPEARLRAIALQAARGTRGQCGAIDRTLQWRNDEYGVDAGPYAPALAAAARQRCQ